MAVVAVRARRVPGSTAICTYCKTVFGPMPAVDLDVATHEHECVRGENQSWRFHDHYWVDGITAEVC